MFENIKMRFGKGYIRPDQLRQYVVLGVINTAQYKDICGKEY